MRFNRYSLLVALAAWALAPAAQAQYGSGASITVPMVPAGTITPDGDASEAAWDNAVAVDLVANWDPYELDEPDIIATGKLLFSEGVLYVYVLIEDYEFYWGDPGNPGNGDQIIVGVDLPYEGGENDPNWAGWPENAPNLGPVAYKVSAAPDLPSNGITLNWSGEISPADSGWVAGAAFADESDFTWGVEMAIYGAEVTEGGRIGFNIGGAAGAQWYADDSGGEGTYGYFAWQVCPEPNGACEYPGGNVFAGPNSYATLVLGEGTSSENGPAAAVAALRSSPNPSRGTAAVAYTLDRPGTVELAAYDVLGRRVAVLDAGARAAGTHPATLDAALPAGVYVLRLTVDGVPAATHRVTRVQ